MTNIEALKQSIDKLDQRDQNFAKSLVTQAAYKTLSPKQLYWVDKLLVKASGAALALANPAPQPSFPNLLPVVNLLKQAHVHLKRPGLRFGHIRLRMAGERARIPGSINVTKDYMWCGRVLEDGSFVQNRGLGLPDDVTELLVNLAADPIKTATDYGRLTGRCAFCSLPLEDERSTFRGYGPICSKHYNLPWGNR